MAWNIGSFAGQLHGYTELRAHENRDFQMVFLNGQMTTNSSVSNRGISARHFQRGGWGFASHRQIDAPNIERVLLEAKANARLLSRIDEKEPALMTVPGAKGRIDLSTQKQNSRLMI